MNPEFEYRQARKRVKKKKGFYKHLTAYMIVIGFLFAINMLTDPFDWWFYFPALGWGVGLAFHYVGVFGLPGLQFSQPEWEDREMEKELRKARRLRQPLLDQADDSEPLPDELELKELRKNYNDGDFV